MPADSATTALPTARGAAFDLLGAVLRRRRALDEALEAPDAFAGLEPRDRAFARLLVATALRRLGQLDALAAHCLETPLPPRAVAVHDVLRLGIVQLLFLATPPHAAVATSVDLAEQRGLGHYKALVNAVLRRLAGEGAALVAAQDAGQLNTPAWLWRSWSAAYGEAGARAIAAAHLEEAPLDITAPGERESWRDKLDATELPTGTLRRTAGGAVAALPGYAEGAWWVQDAAAALPARLLGPVAGRPVVDLCAAPGGKTAQLAAAGAQVTAIDRSPRRVERLKANLARLGLAAECLVADAAEWRPAAPQPFILIDAPCTATGTIRRHPDVQRLKTPEDVTRLATAQQRLLAAAAAMLAPGGTLVYCTCSLEPAEGVEQVERLLAETSGLARRPIEAAEIGGLAECVSPAGDLRTLPCHLASEGGLDGFYAARLARRG